MNGRLNSEGFSTIYYFEYGLTTAYGATTDGFIVGSGFSDVPVSADLTGLTAGTTYHFRLVGISSDSAGITRGVDWTFSTLPANIGSISGRVSVNLFGNNDLNLRSATVTLQGTQYSVLTDGNGNFTLANVPFGDYTIVITAPNLNPIIQNVSVTQQSLQITLPPIVVEQSSYLPGDVNGDGILGLADAIYVLQVLSGLRQQ